MLLEHITVRAGTLDIKRKNFSVITFMMCALIVTSLILPFGGSWGALRDIGPATSSFHTPDSDDWLANEKKVESATDLNRCLDLLDISLVKNRRHFSSTLGTLYCEKPKKNNTKYYRELTKQT